MRFDSVGRIFGVQHIPLLRLALAAAAVLAIAPRDAAAQSVAQRVQQLEQKVAALEAKTQPATLSVDCSAGQKVNDAITAAMAYVGHVTILIRGTCVEAVQLSRSNTALVGIPAATGATIQAPTPNDEAFHIGGALNVFANRLTVTGGHVGLKIQQQSSVHLFNVKIVDNGFHGLFVDSASVLLRDSFVERNGGAGVFVWNSGHAAIANTLIADSGEDGLDLQNGSSAQLQDGTRLTRNNDGIRLWLGSSLDLHNNTSIDFNNGQGLSISFGSKAWSNATGVFIQDNTQDGVHIGDSSVFSPGPTVIQRNGGWGVNCRPAPEVPQLIGGLNAPDNGLGAENCPVVTP